MNSSMITRGDKVIENTMISMVMGRDSKSTDRVESD